MAVPSVWGSVVDDYGKIGISVSVTYPNATTASVSIEVWISTKYSATDANNNFWFDDNAQSASTSRGSRSIKTTVNSGAWSTGNYQQIYTYPTFTVNRTTSNQTRYCAAKLSGVEIVSGTMTHSVGYTIKALDSYDISYSPNGMSCAVPATHKKYYGINTTVSATVPITEGYTCTGWVTAAPEGKFYPFGAQYTANTSAILYANWVKNKYKITLYPNEGTFYPDGGIIGSVTAQIVEFEKEHGASCVIPTPVRANYNFLGWGASPSANTVSYVPGASYTANTPVTLYAVWELAYVPPILRNVVIQRSDADGDPTDEGTHLNISFEWETDKNFANKDGTTGAEGTRIVIKAIDSDGYVAKLGTADDGSLIDNFEIDISDFNGILNEIAVGPPGADGIGPISTELNYTVYIEVFDTHGSIIIQRSIMPIAYPIDVYKEGKGIAFGKPAKYASLVDSAWPIMEQGMLLSEKYYPTRKNCSNTDFNSIKTAGLYYGYTGMTNAHWPDRISVLEVLEYSSDWVVQKQTKIPTSAEIALFGNEPPTWTRVFHSGTTWTPWVNESLKAYPINSIYISYSHTSPAELFGGTWTRISPYFLYGTGETGVIGETGGENSHVLKPEEMPKHSHWGLKYAGNSQAITLNNGSGAYRLTWTSDAGSGIYPNDIYTGEAGGDQPHNNLPPFIKVSIWRRIA